MKKLSLYIMLIALTASYTCLAKDKGDFKKLNASSDWELKMTDDCTEDWTQEWFMDGLLATVKHSAKGMDFSAGPINRNDAHHAVLWTKKSFEGDIKIEYNYTRTDSQLVNVNILYIQATGLEKEGFGKDISAWNAYREIPTMSKYYYNMNALHVSYAAFKMVNNDPEADYIRIRKYPAEQDQFGKTDLKPAFYETGLFKTGITYAITVIKTGEKLYIKVKGADDKQLFAWDLNETQRVNEGRIGLRHMFTRSARYSDFKVYTKQ